MLQGTDHTQRALPVLFEALALLKKENAPRDPAWLHSFTLASMVAADMLKECRAETRRCAFSRRP